MLALPKRHFYLVARLGVAALTGCRTAPVVPAGPFEPASLERLGALADSTMPSGNELLRIRWRSDDGQVSVSGSGAVRIAPDSLRVDVTVRLGVGRATMILTGDDVQAEPPQVVAKLLPDRFALWAAVGVVRLPGGVGQAERLVDGPRTFWRVVDAEGRRWIFEMRGHNLAGVVREIDDRPVERLEIFRDQAGRVSRARATDLVRGARFEVDIVSRQPSGAFPVAIWHLGT